MSPAKKTSAGKKPSAKKKTAAKKTAASPKKTTAKKAASRKTSARSSPPAQTKTAPKKTGQKKSAQIKKTQSKKTAKKTTAKKAAQSKTPASPRTTAKQTAGKKTAARKTSARGPGNANVRRPPGAPRPRPVRPAKFDKKQLSEIRQNLEAKRAELQVRQKELDVESFDSTQSDITGEVGLDEDFADAGTATFERERDLSIRNNIEDLIDQMTRAIARIDDGTYGTCERCGKPIDAARLKELPHALLCLDCKRREERAR
jgi:RNA polymerase-binding protein DksA